MYVACHKCAAAYVLEERLLGGDDARAQCPNCLHVQAVAPVKKPPAPPTIEARRAVAPGNGPVTPVRIPSIPPVAPPLAPGAIDDSLLTGTAVQRRDGPDRCRECNSLLTDAFDRALGICERCRTDSVAAPPGDTAVGADTEFSGRQDLNGAIGPTAWTAVALSSGEDGDRRALDGAGLWTEDESDAQADTESDEVARPLPPPLRNPSLLMNAAVRSVKMWRAGPVFAGTVVLLALAAVGGLVSIQRRAPKLAKRVESARLAAQLENVRQRWSRDAPGLQGDALQLVKQGRADLAKDTPRGYETAEQLFRKSFLLDAQTDEAFAGYLQAVAWGRGAELNEVARREMTTMIQAAEAQWGRSPRLLAAQASLLLLSADSPADSQARSLAEQAAALSNGRDKALAHLVLASAFLQSSAELALQNIELALQLDPTLRRAYLLRALARESLGDYPSAISDLEQRLSMDAEQWQVRAALSRLYQELGAPALAYKLYPPSAAAGRDVRFATARAIIRYQSEQKPQLAAQELRDFLRGRESDGDPQLLDAWVHLAAAERLAGRREPAAAAAARAQQLSSTDPAARLQLFLVALSRGSLEEAARHLSALRRRLGNAALEKILEGRLALAQHSDAEAMRAFADAAQLDSRRLDALLLAGAAAASAGRRDETLRYLVPAGQMDPTRAGPALLATRLYVRPEDNLAAADGRVIRLAKGATDATPRLYEALIRFHQREWGAADRLLGQVLDVDIGNALAHALRALIALHRGALRPARASAERAVSAGRAVALAHYAYGTVLMRSGNWDAAQVELRQAESLAPTLLATQVSLAEVEAKKKSVDAARSRLVHVLRVDPTYLAAKRALYALEQ
jgi:predicted Zn finger-like uncharacterized protein